MKKDVSFANAEEAFHQEGTIASIERKAFEERLASPDVRETLEEARALWKRLYGDDPLAGRSRSGPGSSTG